MLNKVRCADGGWRTIDGHEIYAHKKSAGVLYQAALRNELTRTLGVSWTPVSKDGQAEIAGVPTELMRTWSKRTAQTLHEAEPVIATYEQLLGRPLTSAERVAVEKVAVVKTRPHKDAVDIVSLTDRWRDEAETLGWTPQRLQQSVRDAIAPRPAQAQVLAAVDRALVDAVIAAGGRRAVFTRSDLAVEVAARVPTAGFSGDMTRELLERLTDRALATAEAVRLQDQADGPHRASDARYCSRTTLTRELEIIAVADTGRHDGVAVCDLDTLMSIVRGGGLDEAQVDAIASLCSDGAVISVLVAPAGTGKTTTLGAATVAWQHELHRVHALAPSARAARELGTATGLQGDTVAKFLHEQQVDRDPRDPAWARYYVGAGDVVVVDEASMLPTADLHALARLVWERRAKLVLVGDPAQINAIDQAGGMLPALAHRLSAPHLDTVHRFNQPWERQASLLLRDGNPNAIGFYLDHQRVHTPDGSDDDAMTALFRHYTELTGGDRRVLMLARSNSDVDELNARARQQALETGDVHGQPLLTVGDREWRAGDRLRVTRNDRRIPVGADALRNGDVFTVTGRTATGLTVQRIGSADVAELPVAYVAEHARYGWASTIASAQGATVDDALLLARPGLDRTNLYVGMTRGRDTNHLYLAPDAEPEINPRNAVGRQVDVVERIRQMLATNDDAAAAHTRLPDRAAPRAADWPRRQTRAELLAQITAAPRRRGLGIDPHHIAHPYPERGYGRDFGR